MKNFFILKPIKFVYKNTIYEKYLTKLLFFIFLQTDTAEPCPYTRHAVLVTASPYCADNVSKEQGDCGTSPQ